MQKNWRQDTSGIQIGVLFFSKCTKRLLWRVKAGIQSIFMARATHLFTTIWPTNHPTKNENVQCFEGSINIHARTRDPSNPFHCGDFFVHPCVANSSRASLTRRMKNWECKISFFFSRNSMSENAAACPQEHESLLDPWFIPLSPRRTFAKWLGPHSMEHFWKRQPCFHTSIDSGRVNHP